MADLLKIKEVSSRYDVTARTLRYYEDMGLINSLSISIKDIQRIFRSSGSEIVLEVLGSFDIWFCEYDKMRKGISL